MNLFRLNNGKMEELDRSKFSLEKEIQKIIEGNLFEVFSLQFVASELTVEKFRIDTLAFDEETNSFVIIEYKKGSSYSVVDQGYSYLSVMLNNKADFILEYNERMDQSLRRNDVDWSSSRVIFISQNFNTYQKNSVNFKDIPFELWEIKRFNDDIISLAQHHASSTEGIELLKGAAEESTIKKVSAEIKVYEEKDHTSNASENCLLIWEAMKEEITAWDDVNMYATKHYIGFKKNASLFSAVRFFRNHISIDISRGNISPAGKHSKLFFTAEDPKDKLEKRDWTHKNGSVGNSYILKLTSNTELEYAKFLIQQKYSSV
jgi:hypothetical protein